MRIAGKKISVIASDFDGTIIRHGQTAPTERFYELADECLDKDIFFVAASGRQYPNLYRMLHELKREIAYIAENGSLVMYRREVIYKAVIADSLVQELLADLQQENGHIQVSGQETAYALDKNQEFLRYMREDVGNIIEGVKAFCDIEEPIIKIAVYMPDGIPEEMAERYHAKYDGRLQVVDAGNCWFDFNPLESSKGVALQMLTRKLGLDPEQTVVFGDGENDIAMLKEGAVSFAMDTAKDNVKVHAQYICDCVEDVIRYGLDQEAELEAYAAELAESAGESREAGAAFWNRLKQDPEILEEFEYFYHNRDFLCRHKVAGYSVVDILVWQVDHFKAYLDRHFEVKRYDRDRLVYSAFDVLLKMRTEPEFYVKKLQNESGTDSEHKRYQ